MSPPTFSARLPAEVRLVQDAPTDERSVWVWRVCLVGNLPSSNKSSDDILIHMRKEGVRPERKRFILLVPGRSPAQEAGDDLQELLDRCLTKGTLLKYVEYLVERYSSRLRTKLLQDAGLYSYAMSL